MSTGPDDPRDWPTEQFQRPASGSGPIGPGESRRARGGSPSLRGHIAEVMPEFTRAGLREWSGQRPWLGGLLTIAGGMLIAAIPNSDFSVVILPGLAGLSGLFLGTLIIACGLFLLFSPQIHGLIGLATVMLSLVAFITSNLGGLIIGMLLGIIGGSMGFAWVPADDRRP
jgi:hypothetical protein